MASKRNWTIVYSDYSGMQRKAIELLSKELGALLIRDKGVFTLHVLPCIKTETAPEGNFVVAGLYENNALIRKYVEKSEIPEDGFLVKVIDDPENTERKIAVITGGSPRNVFYGACAFVDDYIPFAAPVHGGLKIKDVVFNGEKLPDWSFASSPKFKTRSIFTWGHPITDFRAYIENMARLKFNQLIIWNTHLPINADEVVDYAHEFEIEVIWGYSWGWRNSCADPEYLKSILSDLPALKKRVVDEYVEKYSQVKGDGIYFQSFTELTENTVGGKTIAEIVTQFVNETADAIFQIKPGLHIQFGLHATSVKEKLHYIANVDPRIEILWEDCGSFPFNYLPECVHKIPRMGTYIPDENYYENTWEFTKKILEQRDAPAGLLYKGMMTLDWCAFANQAGPYIIGRDSEAIIRHDAEMEKPIWRMFEAEWMQYGKYALEMTKRIYAHSGSSVNMCLAGNLPGAMWMPFALVGEMFWDCDGSFDDMLERVVKRSGVNMA